MSAYTPEGLDDEFTPDARTAARTDTADRLDASDGSGAVAADEPTALPQLGATGWLRWGWRQLTSMRVALLLLMLLAVAAVPGSVWPQRSQAPERVDQYLLDHPDAGPWLERAGMFDVYSSAWFSAIYLLLFVSLVGCILPRTRAHLRALRARPPRTPRRFDRFPAQGGGTIDGDPETLARTAATALRGPLRWLPRFRTDVRDEPGGSWSVSAERGYLRESGNLLFHLALVGLLVSIATGQLFHYRGQAIVVEGRGFANAQTDYDTFESGAGFDPASLVPFTLRLDRFTSRFDPDTLQSRDFLAEVTLTEPGEEPRAETIKVNHPLTAGGAKVYLQGNGYAPDVVVRDAAGEVAFAGPVTFIPKDEVYTSQGVIKVPDVSGGQPQVGLVGSLLPTAEQVTDSVWRSVDPQPTDPVFVLAVWKGDLGLDTGVPQNVYELDSTGMEQVTEPDGTPATLYVRPGETVELPDGLGTIELTGVPRFVALDLRRDPALPFVLTFALAAFAGLAVSLFTPRRRVWVRATPDPARPGRTVVTAAALARGDDLGLQAELDTILGALALDPADDATTAPSAPHAPNTRAVTTGAPAEETTP
jgi:cytochrome c biogenesis protein